MARDRTARSRIRQYLATAGPLDEPSGHATTALKEAIDYQGSSVAFIQLIAAMDRDGEIEREIRGKRTYRISGTGRSAVGIGAPAYAPATARVEAVTADGGSAVVEIDYDRLARALVREFLSVAGGQAVEAEAPEDDDAARLAAERDDYLRRLAEAREKLDELLGDPQAASVARSAAGAST
ncbi:hypothetical protein [Nocardioides endophyticus]|uniref:hypothetical protein n=1 Tax=Nocardioides endophyticus TaxID=1353775 RepID=UPI0031E8455B